MDSADVELSSSTTLQLERCPCRCSRIHRHWQCRVFTDVLTMRASRALEHKTHTVRRQVAKGFE
eukprot:6460719-Amphidinium_carterae.1